MDELGLLILLALAIPVMAIAGLVLGLTARGRIAALERRVTALEGALARGAAAEQTPAPSPAVTSSAPTPQPAPEASRPPVPSPATSAPVPSTRKPTPPKPGRSLEELVGARWSVIVGGLALALGGVFLVRYSIEQGLLGPAARVTLGALFSAGLLLLGERLRRGETAKDRKPIDIPAVITSAGAVSAFATVYAAYALYGFLGPAAAFIALGIVAVATLLAALLHGPMLGAAGLIGAYGAPFLVSSDEPNALALFAYLFAPTAAAFAVARMRNWPPLALAAGGAAFAWGALAVLGGIATGAGPLLIYVAGLIALAAAMHSGGVPKAPEAHLPDWVCGPLIALFALLAVAAPAIDGFGATTLAATSAVMLFLLGLAAWAPGLAPLAPVGVVLAALVTLSFDDSALSAMAEATSLPAPGETPRSDGLGSFLTFCGVIGAAFLAAGAFAARRASATPAWRTGLLAAAAAAAPLLVIASAYWRVSEFAPDLRFATVAVLVAAALAALTEDSARREASGAASPAATAAFATGACAALGLALAMAMREGGLTVALAFLAMALGLVAVKRSIRALGWLAMIASAIVLIRIAIDPKIVGDSLGTTPIFNALLWGYGAPMVAFWIGSRAFSRAGQTIPAQALEGLSLVFALLLGFMQARHFANGGDVEAVGVGLLEAGLDATVAFALSAAAGKLSLGRASPVLSWGALAAGAIGCVIALLGLLFGANPYFSGEPVEGGALFNTLMPGYLLPALAAFAAARFAGKDRPVWLRRAFGSAALALAFAYLTLLVRFIFAGPVLDGPFESDAEWYVYSAVWLVFALALLAVGVIRRSQTLRLASALIAVAVILKVFLLDLAGLGGVWRPISFIGLGGVLIGVGLVYQRLLFPKGAATA